MGRRKYLVEVDGHGYQASLAAKLLLRSAVLSQSSGWRLWCDPLLVRTALGRPGWAEVRATICAEPAVRVP